MKTLRRDVLVVELEHLAGFKVLDFFEYCCNVEAKQVEFLDGQLEDLDGAVGQPEFDDDGWLESATQGARRYAHVNAPLELVDFVVGRP
jgi:hypothetical protein